MSTSTELYLNQDDLEYRLRALSCCIGELGTVITNKLLGGGECVEKETLLRQLIVFKKLFKNYIPVGTDIITVPARSAEVEYTASWNWTGGANIILTVSSPSPEVFTLTGQTGLLSYFDNLIERINTTSTVGYKAEWNPDTFVFTLIAPESLGATKNSTSIIFAGSGSVSIPSPTGVFANGRTEVSTVSTEDDNIITEEEAQNIWDWISRQCQSCFKRINESLCTDCTCIEDPQNNDIVIEDPSDEGICLTSL